jgi:hypothetical protein
VQADADTGISVDVASTGRLHDRLTALGYEAECGNRYERGEQTVDLLVPAAAKPGMQIIGERAFDGAPGLRVALALPPIQVAVAARLTAGDMIEFEVPVPDVEAAFVLKMLVRTVRDSERDLQDIETLLEIVASQPEYRASPWRMDDPKITKQGERGDAARVAAQMISSPPTKVPARARALLWRHVAVPSRAESRTAQYRNRYRSRFARPQLTPTHPTSYSQLESIFQVGIVGRQHWGPLSLRGNAANH